MDCSEGNVREARRWRMVPDIDLNHSPPDENNAPDILSASANPQEVQAEEHGQSHHQSTMDVEVIDDEVAIISPRIFVEAKSMSNRNRMRAYARNEVSQVNNGYSESPTWLPLSGNMHERSQRNWELNINLEVSKKTKIKSVPIPPEWSLSEPLSEAPTFSCAVCKDSLTEEMATKCGHIFCKKCIQAAIAVQKKCPTCRRKITMRDIIRIYLPAIN